MTERLPDVIRSIMEMSFTDKDVPRYFRVALDFNANGVKSQLQKGVLSGVRGISDNGEVAIHFLPYRDSLLIMDGKKVVQLNKLSRIMYGNPEYMMSNSLKAMRRVHAELSLEAMISRILEELKNRWVFDGGSVESELSYRMEYQKLARDIARYHNGVSTPLQFAKTMLSVAKMRADTSYDATIFWNGLKERPERKLAGEIRNAVLKMEKSYSYEGEWVLKNDDLKIPNGSILMILMDTAVAVSAQEEFKRQWDFLSSKYKVKFLSAQEFNKKIDALVLSRIKHSMK